MYIGRNNPIMLKAERQVINISIIYVLDSNRKKKLEAV